MNDERLVRRESHGWVFPHPSGARAKCGGPGLCDKCKQDLAELRAMAIQARDVSSFLLGLSNAVEMPSGPGEPPTPHTRLEDMDAMCQCLHTRQAHDAAGQCFIFGCVKCKTTGFMLFVKPAEFNEENNK